MTISLKRNVSYQIESLHIISFQWGSLRNIDFYKFSNIRNFIFYSVNEYLEVLYTFMWPLLLHTNPLLASYWELFHKSFRHCLRWLDEFICLSKYINHFPFSELFSCGCVLRISLRSISPEYRRVRRRKSWWVCSEEPPLTPSCSKLCAGQNSFKNVLSSTKSKLCALLAKCVLY